MLCWKFSRAYFKRKQQLTTNYHFAKYSCNTFTSFLPHALLLTFLMTRKMLIFSYLCLIVLHVWRLYCCNLHCDTHRGVQLYHSFIWMQESIWNASIKFERSISRSMIGRNLQFLLKVLRVKNWLIHKHMLCFLLLNYSTTKKKNIYIWRFGGI